MFAASRGASSFCTYPPAERQNSASLIGISIRINTTQKGRGVLTESAASVSQGFAGLQGVGDAFLRFLFAAERHECLALEIEHILLADHLRCAQWSASQDVREFACHQGVVIRSVPAPLHQVN